MGGGYKVNYTWVATNKIWKWVVKRGRRWWLFFRVSHLNRIPSKSILVTGIPIFFAFPTFVVLIFKDQHNILRLCLLYVVREAFIYARPKVTKETETIVLKWVVRRYSWHLVGKSLERGKFSLFLDALDEMSWWSTCVGDFEWEIVQCGKVNVFQERKSETHCYKCITTYIP